jgi:hypothetical protein
MISTQPERTNSPGTSATHAGIMFIAALVFLAVVAVITQWWNSSQIVDADSAFTARIIVYIWAPFIAEALLGFLLNTSLPGNFRRLLMIVLLPPLRITYSTYSTDNHVWLPGLGWQQRGQQLFDRIDQFLMMPMLVIAIMIVPVLGVEFLLKDKIGEMPTLGLLLDGCAAFIWFAFALEFLVMVSISEEKVNYCKRHWLNLIIIILPLISFLRGFQVVRAFRVAKAGKLLRVYRMRSLLLRIYQTLLAISAIERLLNRNPHKHLTKLQKQLEEKEEELQRLRNKIAALKRSLELKDN